MIRLAILLLLFPLTAFAQGYSEPARGSVARAALMDAIRPHAEWNFGTPVEFVAKDLRVSGAVGYASLSPQRPGGARINLPSTPLAKRGEIDPEFYEGVYMHVLYQKSGTTWVAVHWSIGATDVWWADPELCLIFRDVTPEACY